MQGCPANCSHEREREREIEPPIAKAPTAFHIDNDAFSIAKTKNSIVSALSQFKHAPTSLRFSMHPHHCVTDLFKVGNLSTFAHIGLIYALGDIFEMESVNYIDSSTYTVLSKSKLVFI